MGNLQLGCGEVLSLKMTLESTLEMYASDQLLEDSDFSVMVRDTENSLKDNLLVTFWCVRPQSV